MYDKVLFYKVRNKMTHHLFRENYMPKTLLYRLDSHTFYRILDTLAIDTLPCLNIQVIITLCIVPKKIFLIFQSRS